MKSARYSQYFIPTLKEEPKEAEIPSHKLMIRAGMIRKLASGVYEFLPLGWKVIKKIENIIRREMDSINGQEILMSALQPRRLWDRSGRWDLYGPELMRLKDRKERDFCLGPTHEEVITSLVGGEVKSYKRLPLLLYQFQMKFRDEIRPRFGVMRAREFYMKDAYSFDTDIETCRKSYESNVKAYNRIFKNCGLDFLKVEAATGNIGGSSSHEFMVVAETGEDEIAICTCGYAANTELAAYEKPENSFSTGSKKKKKLNKVHTPGKKTVEEVSEFLGADPKKFIKTLIYETKTGLVAVLVRGDHELNENLLAEFLGDIKLASRQKIKEATGAPIGFAGPVGLEKEKISKIIADTNAVEIKNAFSGANEKDYHFKNINCGRDYQAGFIGNFRKALPGDLCPKCSKLLDFKRGIEVGHTFLLGEKYSKSMDATFTDSDGKEKNMIMGCYGIGVSRIAAAAIEQSHDKDGIVWPSPIAPFTVHIIQISDKVSDYCSKLFSELAEDYEVFLDDRDESPGIKFKDAQLIGCPAAVVVGRTYTREGKLELQCRKTGRSELIAPENIKSKLKEILKND